MLLRVETLEHTVILENGSFLLEPTQHESRSSVEISRTAKGDATWSVKVYRAPGEEEEAKEIAIKLNADLTKLYYPATEIQL